MRYAMLWKNKTGKEKGLARSANGSAGLFFLNDTARLTNFPICGGHRPARGRGRQEQRLSGAEARQGAEGCRASSALFAGYRLV